MEPSRSKPRRTGASTGSCYQVDGDHLTFTWEPPTPPPVPAPETITWSYFNGALHFKPTYVGDPVSRLIYEHTWRKVR